MLIIILLLIGIMAGFVAGLLGVGGGIIFTPILLYLFTYNQVADPVSFTIATSIVCTLAASLSSSVKHLRSKNIVWKEGLIIGASGFIGSWLGKTLTLSPYYEQQEFTIVFAGIMFFTAYNFIRNAGRQKSATTGHKDEIPLHIWLALLIGIAAGFVAAVAGLGGGIVIVPILTMILHKPFDRAIGISSFSIVIITFLTALQYALAEPNTPALSAYNVGYVDFGTALPLVAGSVLSAQWGVKMGISINQRLLKRVFAVLIVIVACKMIWDVV